MCTYYMHGLFSNSWRRLEAQAVCSTEERIPPAGRLPTLHNSQLWQLDFLCASWILEAPCAGFSQIQAMSIPEKNILEGQGGVFPPAGENLYLWIWKSPGAPLQI